VRVFKNIRFTRFADKEGITDRDLRETVDLLDVGKFDADLGGDVYKIRMARDGEGKSGGYRVIVVFRRGQRTFYVYGFAKSQKGNISRREKRELKELAKELLGLSDEAINQSVKAGRFIEI